MGQETRSKRPYDSSGRRKRAAERRSAVIDAAADMFAARGIERTTIAEIADAAGVSVPYLQKLGTKTDLFEMAIERVTVGPQQRTVEQAREELEADAIAVTRSQFIRNMAALSAQWNARSYGMWRAWANTDDPDLRSRWDATMADIRAAWAGYLDMFDDRGWWRTDVPRSEQVAAIWLFTMAETYERMTVVAGLSRDEYEQWLHRAMEAVLVDPRG